MPAPPAAPSHRSPSRCGQPHKGETAVWRAPVATTDASRPPLPPSRAPRRSDPRTAPDKAQGEEGRARGLIPQGHGPSGLSPLTPPCWVQGAAAHNDASIKFAELCRVEMTGELEEGNPAEQIAVPTRTCSGMQERAQIPVAPLAGSSAGRGQRP